MEVLCTVVDENKEQWKAVEASGEYRRLEIPWTYSAPLSPLPQLEKCKIERQLNALQLSTCPDITPEDSKYHSFRSESDLWTQTNGGSEKKSCNETKLSNHSGLLKIDREENVIRKQR